MTRQQIQEKSLSICALINRKRIYDGVSKRHVARLCALDDSSLPNFVKFFESGPNGSRDAERFVRSAMEDKAVKITGFEVGASISTDRANDSAKHGPDRRLLTARKTL